MLKSGDQKAVVEMFTRLQQETRSVIKNVIELVYFMRGAISYDDMMFRTMGERDMIKDFLDKRMDAEKDNPHPTY